MALPPTPPIQYRDSIHGFSVKYLENGRPALSYLKFDLQAEEARTIFDAARANGQAAFEDEREGQYTLVYNRGENTYTIVKRG